MVAGRCRFPVWVLGPRGLAFPFFMSRSLVVNHDLRFWISPQGDADSFYVRLLATVGTSDGGYGVLVAISAQAS